MNWSTPNQIGDFVVCPTCGAASAEAQDEESAGDPSPRTDQTLAVSHSVCTECREKHERIRAGVQSHVGMIRKENQDSVLLVSREPDNGPASLLLLVADGMGGHQGGATASRIAVDTHDELFDEHISPTTPAILEHAVALANSRILEKTRLEPSLQGMGTTTVGLLMAGPDAICAHVGDSRVYRLRHDGLELITRDHSWRNALIDQGREEEAMAVESDNILARCVGMVPSPLVEVSTHERQIGDRWVICSDGLNLHVSDQDIARILIAATTPAEAVDRLIKAACDGGGMDNVSVGAVFDGPNTNS